MRSVPRLCVALATAIVLTIAFLASALADRCLMAGPEMDCCPEVPALIAVNGGCACMAPAGPDLQDAQEVSRSVSPLVDVVTCTLPRVSMSWVASRSAVDVRHPTGELVSPVRLRTLRI